MHAMPYRFLHAHSIRHFLLVLLVWATFCRPATAQNARTNGTVQSQLVAIQNYCKAAKGYGTTSAPGLFLALMDSGHEASQWRKYRSKDEVRNAGANESAYVWIRDAKVIFVLFTFQSESGDWANDADYCFREDGSVAEVDAELQTFYGNMLVKRAWFYAPRAALLAKTEGFFDLHTGRVETPGQDFIDEKTPQFRNVKSLPFASLLPDPSAIR